MFFALLGGAQYISDQNCHTDYTNSYYNNQKTFFCINFRHPSLNTMQKF